jgi:pathogenesis-related protein 1
MTRKGASSTYRLWLSIGVGAALWACLVGCEEDDPNNSVVGDGGGGSSAKPGGGSASVGGTTSSASNGGTLSAMAAEFVTATNAVRATVTEPASYKGTWTPLPDVTWSDAVAVSAQTWVDHLAENNDCGLEHENQSTYGENLAMGSGLSATAAVELWASEAGLYTWSAKYTVEDFNKGSGHYTQLVWRDSIQIGCGSASCGQVAVISCRYSPAGNMIGGAVY